MKKITSIHIFFLIFSCNLVSSDVIYYDCMLEEMPMLEVTKNNRISKRERYEFERRSEPIINEMNEKIMFQLVIDNSSSKLKFLRSGKLEYYVPSKYEHENFSCNGESASFKMGPSFDSDDIQKEQEMNECFANDSYTASSYSAVSYIPNNKSFDFSRREREGRPVVLTTGLHSFKHGVNKQRSVSLMLSEKPRLTITYVDRDENKKYLSTPEREIYSCIPEK